MIFTIDNSDVSNARINFEYSLNERLSIIRMRLGQNVHLLK